MLNWIEQRWRCEACGRYQVFTEDDWVYLEESSRVLPCFDCGKMRAHEYTEEPCYLTTGKTK